MDATRIENIPFFFIVGSARSGTTLLQQILDANPTVIIPTESKLILHLKAFYQHETNWSDEKVEALLDDLYRERHFKQYWHVKRNELSVQLKKMPQDKRSFSSMCKAIYLSWNSIHAKDEIKLIGDKNPVYAGFVPELMEVFPQAKFIHLIRDYRPVALSSVAAFAEHDIYYYAAAWKLQNELVEQEKGRSPQKFYTLKYEDLVADKEKYAREVCNFLGIDFSTSMFDFHIKAKEAYAGKAIEGFERFHLGILNPVAAPEKETWKEKLSETEIRTLEYIVGSYGEKHQYMPCANANAEVLIGKARAAIKKARKDHRVFRFYYTMPGFMRRVLHGTTTLLYRMFGFKHPYNKHDIATVEGK